VLLGLPPFLDDLNNIPRTYVATGPPSKSSQPSVHHTCDPSPARSPLSEGQGRDRLRRLLAVSLDVKALAQRVDLGSFLWG
jgi:hypothetical protein